jgi:hypothetical protein
MHLLPLFRDHAHEAPLPSVPIGLSRRVLKPQNAKLLRIEYCQQTRRVDRDRRPIGSQIFLRKAFDDNDAARLERGAQTLNSDARYCGRRAVILYCAGELFACRRAMACPMQANNRRHCIAAWTRLVRSG